MTDQLQRDPEDWKTGEDPMTEAQASERLDALPWRSPRLNPSIEEGER